MSLTSSLDHELPAELYRQLVESIHDYAIFMLDLEGNVTSWNPGAQTMKGYTAAEIIGQHLSKFYTPEDIAAGRPQANLESAREAGHLEAEGWRVRRDGSRFWATVLLSALRDSNGVLCGFSKVTRDSSKRFDLHRAGRMELILEGLDEGVIVHDRAGRPLVANTAAANACGFATVAEFLRASPDEVLQRFEIFTDEGTPFDLAELPGRRVFAGAGSARAVMRVRDRETSREWWSLIKATAVRDADGTAQFAMNVLHDVSAERRRETRERYVGQASLVLSESLDYESRIAALASLLVPGLADFCVVHLLEDNELRSVSVAHQDPTKLQAIREAYDEHPPNPQHPRGVWNVIRTGRSELCSAVGDAPELRNSEPFANVQGCGANSIVIAPIRHGNRVLGTLSLVAGDSRPSYDAEDVALAEELGRTAGNAIENARLYAAEKSARERLALLVRSGEALGQAITDDHRLESAIRVALPTLGDFAFFDMVEGKEVRRLALAHEDADVEQLIKETRLVRSERTDMNLCALSSGESGFHPRVDDAWMRDVALCEAHLDLLRKLRLTSMITVPITVQRQVIGCLTFCFGKSGRHHSAQDLQLAEELARRTAIAVAQIRTLKSAQLAARQAEEASRFKDEFLATVSHELRTPLAAIMGWSALLRMQSQDPEAVAKGINVIHRNAEAQQKIIDDILDVSRIIAGKLTLDLKVTDVCAVVREAIEVTRPSATAKKIRVSFEHPAYPCNLIADPDRLAQVIWNLLSNAIKFTDSGGNVVIRVSQHGSRIVLSVADSGRGIEPDFLPFVFERFKQADSSTTRRFGGLGLGLAIVRHIAELHGGEVHAMSAGPGKGSTFTLEIPANGAVDAPAPESSTAVEAERALPVRGGSLRGLRVLVAEDDNDARELLETILLDAGATVKTTSSGEEAFTTYSAFDPQVLVSDIGMPGEDGYSLIRRLQAIRQGEKPLPAIALSAYVGAQDAARAVASGFTLHLGKPVHPAALINAIRSVTAQASE